MLGRRRSAGIDQAINFPNTTSFRAMTLSDWIEIFAAAATMILLVAVGISDITRYRIPNVIVYAIVIAFLVGAAFNFAWPAVGWAVAAGVAMFLLGAGLFAIGLFGGGDVKLFAAMALWTGFADLPRFLLVLSAAGGVLGVVMLLLRRRQRPAIAGSAAAAAAVESASEGPLSAAPAGASASVASAEPSSDAASAGFSMKPTVRNRMPYGVAIAIGGFDFFLTSIHSPFAPYWPWMQ
jgi:prepilin peptidase CpaA